jgi:hypothetical protein
MNTFDKMEAVASSTADKHFGETLRVMPQQKAGVNTRPSPDPDRIAFESRGIFSSPATTTVERNKISDVVTKTSKDSEASFDLRNLPYELKQGDEVYRAKTGMLYRIHRLEPDGEGRVCCKLQVIGKR